MRFVIWAPPFGPSAGVKALHRLTHLLNLAGHEAYITATGTNPEWNTPTQAWADEETIVIYPEIAMDHNPLKAKHYIGWALNAPGALGGDKTWKPGSIAFYYHEKFKPATDAAVGYTLPTSRLFILGITERKYFYDDGNQAARSTCACWIYKGAGLRNLYKFPDENKMMMLRMDSATTMAALGDLLRTIKTLYTYDHDSALNYMAQACGCQVIMMGRDGIPFQWAADDRELERFIGDDERDVDRVKHFANKIGELTMFKRKHSGFFVAIYTNACKTYCDREFFGRLRELTARSDIQIGIVDNSVGEDYFERLKALISELKFTVPVNLMHIDVDREDRETLFQRNVTESLIELRQQFLKSDKLFFVTLETDIYPKADNLFELFEDVIDDADIIGGIYYIGWHNVEAFAPGADGLHETHHVLSGCTLYKRKVIEKIPFRWSRENLGAFPDAWIAHDNHGRFRQADYWKIQCKHMTTATGSRGQELLK